MSTNEIALNEVMKETADAIREKKGTSDLIAPVNFAEEIRGITAGGGESASTIEYLDVSGLGETNESLRNALTIFADIVKSKNEEGTFVGACLSGIQMAFGVTTNNATTCVAVAVDFSRHIKGVGNEAGQVIEMSISDILIMMGTATAEELDSIPRITKEQFYSLD